MLLRYESKGGLPGMPQDHILMAFITLGGGMTDITTPEVMLCRLCMAIFPGVCHPVRPGMRDGFLTPVTIRAVGCRVANGTRPPVVGGLLAMLRGFPVEYVIFRPVSLVTILAETILVFVTELTGPVKPACRAVLHGPVTMMTLGHYILPDFCMADIAFNRCLFSIMTFLARKHVGPFYTLKALHLINALVTIATFSNSVMGLVGKYQVSITLRFFRHFLFYFIVIMGTLEGMAHETII